MDRWKTTVGLLGAAMLAAVVAPRLEGVAAPDPEPAVLPPIELPAKSAAVEPPAPWVSFQVTPLLRRVAPPRVLCQDWVPAGPAQIQVLQAIRAGSCAEALDKLAIAMDVSPDHCGLYGAVWRCFVEEHRRPLERKGGVSGVEELVPYLAHLEGDRSSREQQVLDYPALQDLPRPYHPATDGLEKLIEEFDADPRHRDAITDLYGPGTAADRIGDLLVLELRIASALAALPAEELTPRVEELLARRVYVLGRALSGPIGALLADERPELFSDLHRGLEAVQHVAPASARDALETARQ